MIPVLALIGIVVSIIAWKIWGDAWTAFIGLVSLIIIVGTSSIYLLCIGSIAEIEAFKEATMQNYEVAIEETKNAVIVLEKRSGLDISVENLKQSLAISDRIVELRNETEKYNRWIYKFKRYNNSIWLCWVYPNPPEELLKPIVWKEE